MNHRFALFSRLLPFRIVAVLVAHPCRFPFALTPLHVIQRPLQPLVFNLQGGQFRRAFPVHDDQSGDGLRDFLRALLGLPERGRLVRVWEMVFAIPLRSSLGIAQGRSPLTIADRRGGWKRLFG